MIFKILFSGLALASLAFLVWYLVIGNDSGLFNSTPDTNIPVENPFPYNSNPNEEELTRAPGTIASVNNEPISDIPILESTTTKEISTDFFQMTGNTELYEMYYDAVSGIITITLYGIDTKKSRAEAEEYILENLPYSKDQWCSFVTRVITNEFENPQLAGQELGLSFCPGAIQL